MNCPECNSTQHKVTYSRDYDERIKRRRQCLQCGARWTTYEAIDPTSVNGRSKVKVEVEGIEDKGLTPEDIRGIFAEMRKND